MARHSLGLPDDGVVVAVVGRITGIKRPDRLADVVALLRSSGVPVHVVVAGGGDLEATLAARVARDDLPVTMLGWRSDLESILAAADIALLTSDNEGTPLSLVQAGLAGIPAAATDVGSVAEVVEHGVTGILCPPSAPELAAAVHRLAADPGLRTAMGQAARAKAERDFSMAGFLEGHRRVYGSVLGRR
jgi:glycosyltransferase involved in cell wall biosynthesis